MPPANTAPVIDIPTRGGSADRARGIDLDPGADKAGIENLAIDAAVGDRQGAGDRPGIADIAGEGRTGNVDRRSDAGIVVRERSGIGHDKPPARFKWRLTKRLVHRFHETDHMWRIHIFRCGF